MTNQNKQNNNKQPKQACKFCKPVSQPVLDSNGKPTKEKKLQHDVTVPHPTIFGFGTY